MRKKYSLFTQQYNPIVIIWLLLLSIVVKVPSFHSHFFNIDESIYWISAQRLVEGGVQYIDTWENKPPLIIWFYSLFALLGNSGFYLLKIFSVFWLFIGSILFQQFIVECKWVNRFNILPGTLYILLLATPWYAQELNTEHIMLVLMQLATLWTIQYFVDSDKKWSYLFWIGVLGGICTGLKYQGVFHFVALLVVPAFFGTLHPREILTQILGFLSIWLLIFMGLYFSFSLNDFWDIGFLYNFDYMKIGQNPGETHSFSSGLFEYAKVWGVWVCLAFIGFSAFRQKFYTFVIKLRKTEIVMFAWLIAGIISVFLGWRRLYLHYFILTIPPVLFYALYWLQTVKKTWIANILTFVGLAFSSFTFALYFFVSSPARFEQIRNYAKPNGWLFERYEALNGNTDEKLLLQDLENKPYNIWITTFEPDLYLRLKRKCSVKYTNASMSFYKMNWLPHHQNKIHLFSKNEEIIQLFKDFKKNPPPYVIDKEGVFSAIIDKMPLLMSKYRHRKIGTYDVYDLEK